MNAMGARVPIRGSLSGRGRLAYSDGEATEAVGMSREGTAGTQVGD